MISALKWYIYYGRLFPPQKKKKKVITTFFSCNLAIARGKKVRIVR